MAKKNIRVYHKPIWLVDIEHRLDCKHEVIITFAEFYKLVDVYNKELKDAKDYISQLEATSNELTELEYDYERLEDDLDESKKEVEKLKLEIEQLKKG